MNSALHCKKQSSGHALIAALVLLGIATLPVLAGLDRVLHQSRLVAGAAKQQQLQTAAQQTLADAIATIDPSDTFPTFSSQRWQEHAWPNTNVGIHGAYLIETLTPLAAISSPHHLVLTIRAADGDGHALFARTLYQLFPDDEDVIKQWPLH